MSELREALADLCHRQWSGWMEYMFSPSRSQRTDAGEKIIPPWAVERWTRQMRTPYAALSEAEKNSDRDEADCFLKKMLPWVESAERRASEAIKERDEYKARAERAERELACTKDDLGIVSAQRDQFISERDELRAKLDAAMAERDRSRKLLDLPRQCHLESCYHLEAALAREARLREALEANAMSLGPKWCWCYRLNESGEHEQECKIAQAAVEIDSADTWLAAQKEAVWREILRSSQTLSVDEFYRMLGDRRDALEAQEKP